MGFLTGDSKNSWQPIMTADTTVSSYWFNWRFLLCAIWIILSGILASVLVLKYEGLHEPREDEGEGATQKESPGVLYEDETWRPCLKGIHPAWLLAFRVVAFFVLLVLLLATGLVDGGSIFYFYTQWTFTLITIYFGLGSLLSMYGCLQYHKKATGEDVDRIDGDAEKGVYRPSVQNSRVSYKGRDSVHSRELVKREPAGILGYAFQIIFQMNAGAVMLTDCVFWFIIVPFIIIKDYNLNFLIINMHTINAVFLLGDAVLNSLRFPWFRIGYFCLWTFTYVVVQWIVHACVRLWWPYPFLDLSSSFAPLWYLLVALLHIPCYGVFAMIMKLKHFLLSTRCPDAYRGVR